MTDQLAPDTVLQQRKRHGCLTAYLIFLLFWGLAYLFVLFTFDQSLLPLWQKLFLVFSAISIMVWAVALFKWKKWGFWGYCITAFSLFVGQLVIGASIFQAFIPLIVIAILYGVLQIGKENKGWNQLEH